MITEMTLNTNGHRLLPKSGAKVTALLEPGEQRPDFVEFAHIERISPPPAR